MSRNEHYLNTYVRVISILLWFWRNKTDTNNKIKRQLLQFPVQSLVVMCDVHLSLHPTVGCTWTVPLYKALVGKGHKYIMDFDMYFGEK